MGAARRAVEKEHTLWNYVYVHTYIYIGIRPCNGYRFLLFISILHVGFWKITPLSCLFHRRTPLSDDLDLNQVAIDSLILNDILTFHLRSCLLRRVRHTQSICCLMTCLQLSTQLAGTLLWQWKPFPHQAVALSLFSLGRSGCVVGKRLKVI